MQYAGVWAGSFDFAGLDMIVLDRHTATIKTSSPPGLAMFTRSYTGMFLRKEQSRLAQVANARRCERSKISAVSSALHLPRTAQWIVRQAMPGQILEIKFPRC